ncbi:MAG: hypothetical protein COT84_05955 [Chlamydiae bacterium CG10_big_fil_rev_8_21_14_0_10_35_9]|nr:MAG: hypothetical protein COT84_05955 [Chlamydiae bacterium CG10_big_fil_rev_8_21_14_0_10_35_9]
MSNLPIEDIAFDHRSITVNQKNFILNASTNESDPNINTVILSLDCRNESSLDWSKELERARKLKEDKFYILWDLNLGLPEKNYPIEDDTLLSSVKIALHQFIQVFWQEFQPWTIGVVLYKGNVPSFSCTKHEEKYSEEVHQLTLLSDYLHLLSFSLPDELQIFTLIEASSLENDALLTYCVSKEKFEYFILALKNSETPISALKWSSIEGKDLITSQSEEYAFSQDVNIGVCFVKDASISSEVLQDFDNLFTHLKKKGISYRILPEIFATEQWDELDYIIVLQKYASDQIVRMLQGFMAAGGTAVSYGDNLGLEGEIPFNQLVAE